MHRMWAAHDVIPAPTAGGPLSGPSGPSGPVAVRIALARRRRAAATGAAAMPFMGPKEAAKAAIMKKKLSRADAESTTSSASLSLSLSVAEDVDARNALRAFIGARQKLALEVERAQRELAAAQRTLTARVTEATEAHRLVFLDSVYAHTDFELSLRQLAADLGVLAWIQARLELAASSEVEALEAALDDALICLGPWSDAHVHAALDACKAAAVNPVWVESARARWTSSPVWRRIVALQWLHERWRTFARRTETVRDLASVTNAALARRGLEGPKGPKGLEGLEGLPADSTRKQRLDLEETDCRALGHAFLMGGRASSGSDKDHVFATGRLYAFFADRVPADVAERVRPASEDLLEATIDFRLARAHEDAEEARAEDAKIRRDTGLLDFSAPTTSTLADNDDDDDRAARLLHPTKKSFSSPSCATGACT